MRYLLCLLFVISSVFAQPDYGPYVVVESQSLPSSGGVKLLAPIEEEWQVFYSFGDTAYHTTLDIESGSIEHLTVLPGSEEGWGRRLCDAVWTEDEYCSALCYDTTVQNNRTRLITYQNDLFEFVQIDSGRNFAIQWYGASIHGFSFLRARPGGGVFAAWVDFCDHWNGSGFWAYVGATVYNLPPDATEIYPEELFYSIGYESRFLIHPVDSLSYYGVVGGYEAELCLHEGFNTIWDVSLDCEFYPVEFLHMQNGRFLVLSEPGYIYETQILEMDSTGYCETLNTFNSDIIASASHIDYGFAWIEQVGRGLQLWRADLNGQPIATEGLIHHHDAYTVDKINLDIADDGTIGIIWCESDASSRTILAAAADWDTPLSTDDSRFIPQPSSLSLSAFPNPFNSSVNLSYELPMSGDVTLSIFNLAGQQVATLVDDRVSAGSHEISWKPDVSSGVYFAHLATPSITKTTKLFYLR